ncbi:IclR family transcriptional regulator [Sciscionella sediminilitoris]|uniref:IclR family transcriptional regulator n=1 Tax=Sciscionella sediminilitoris TaxID=1445613 RepID=UPI0004DF0712|nr:IclR family transcriptional regulator [Sciscionella sp. SE31]
MTDPETGNRSVTRALDVLELLSANEEPLGLADVARALDLPKSSVLNLLRALVAREFVRAAPDGRYSLGVRSFEVGSAYLRRITPVGAAESELRALTEELGMTSHFAVLHDDKVVYLAKHDPPGAVIGLASSLGARLAAATTAVGKAQLAHAREVSVPVSAELAAELDRVRHDGFAVDSGVTATGIECVAAPVFGGDGCCGAIGVSYLKHGAPDGAPDGAQVGAAVLAAAGRASVRLGGGAR